MGVRFARQGRRSLPAIAGIALILPFLSGCAGTIDTLTSQRFRERPFHTMFSSDDPAWVLENVPEGDLRAKAMLEIKEPKSRGGNDEEQNRVVDIIVASATSDKQVVCRFSAIDALSRFDDPRCAKALMTAYHSAAGEAPGNDAPSGVVQASQKVRRPSATISSFTPEQVNRIQCRALEALGKKRSPEGLALLCDVAAKPAKKDIKPVEFDPLAQGDLGQDSSELRLAAIRALANYKNDMQAAEVLYKIMLTERGDIALRSRAYESLKKVTGKDYLPDSPDWKLVIKGKDASQIQTLLNESLTSGQIKQVPRSDTSPSKLTNERLNGAIGP